MSSQPFLSRDALARVLRSLLEAEWRVMRGREGTAAKRLPTWPDTMSFGPDGLGCDSLDLLRLGAATNEMFCLYETGVEEDLLAATTFGAWIDIVERAWASGQERVTFATSGSTGRPKHCTQSRSFLATEVKALAERWQDRQRVVALTPAHHIYGFLFTAMLPDALGIPCLDAEHLGVAALRATLRPGDLLVSFPERWAFLDRSLPAWPERIEGVVSTAPCPAATLASLAEHGLARMTDVYGSSETAGIAWRDTPTEPYRLMPQWSFGPQNDTGGCTLVHQDGGTHRVMDHVTRRGDRDLVLGGRRDGMVQVGGVNVAPDTVAQRLGERPGVRWALVRLAGFGDGGRLKALLGIEPGRDPEATRTAVEAWAITHLTTAERPTAIAVSFDEVKPAKNFDW